MVILVNQLNELIWYLNFEILFKLLLYLILGDDRHGRVDLEWELLLPGGQRECELLFEDVVARHLLALLRWGCITFSIIRLLLFFWRLLLVWQLHCRFLLTIKELIATSLNLTDWIEKFDLVSISQVIFILRLISIYNLRNFENEFSTCRVHYLWHPICTARFSIGIIFMFGVDFFDGKLYDVKFALDLRSLFF
jgi:hypothetical protein